MISETDRQPGTPPIDGAGRSKPERDPLTEGVESAVLGAVILGGATLLAVVLWRCRTGIDFSDEGACLNSISHPWLYKNYTQFGFVYHPLYLLVGGNVVLLRQLNLLITIALAWILGGVMLRTVAPRSGKSRAWEKAQQVALGLTLTFSSLAFLDPWLPTPTYNSLVLQALMLAGVAVLLAEPESTPKSRLGWGLIGVAGWLTFLAKPTSAVALAIVVTAYLLISGKLRLRLLAISLVTVVCLFLTCSWIIDGSVGGFVARLSLSVKDAATLKAGHTFAKIWRIDNFAMGRGEKVMLAVTTGLIVAGGWLALSRARLARVGGSVLTLALAGAAVALTLGVVSPHWGSTPYWGLMFGATIYGGWLTALARLRGRARDIFSRRNIALAVFLLVLPHVGAFGTNANYWVWAPHAGIFWVLAGVLFLAASGRQRELRAAVLPIAAAALAITASLLSSGMETPYRQPMPLRNQHVMIRIGSPAFTVRVPGEVATYLRSLDELARRNGFRAGDPMLDFTGRYPGALFAIGAKAIGRAWMVGGYPGSDALASKTLARIPRQELRRAWILTSPDGPRRLSLQLLKRFGLDLDKDYTDVGTIRTPDGEYPAGLEQHLFKPKRR